jgi:hypothetical protein
MATLDTVLDVETEVEAVFDTLLSASPYSLNAGGTDSAGELTTPRLEIKAEVTKWGPHQITIASGTYSGRRIYDQFQLRLSLDVVFQPEHAQGQATIRGKLRRCLSDWTSIKAGFATRGYLYAAPDTLRQIDGGRIIDNEEKTEMLSSVLELVVFLNPAALAAAT